MVECGITYILVVAQANNWLWLMLSYGWSAGLDLNVARGYCDGMVLAENRRIMVTSQPSTFEHGTRILIDTF